MIWKTNEGRQHPQYPRIRGKRTDLISSSSLQKGRNKQWDKLLQGIMSSIHELDRLYLHAPKIQNLLTLSTLFVSPFYHVQQPCLETGESKRLHRHTKCSHWLTTGSYIYSLRRLRFHFPEPESLLNIKLVWCTLSRKTSHSMGSSLWIMASYLFASPFL